MLDATATLLRGATFGDAAIAFTEVEPAPAHVDRRIVDADGTPLPALDLRLALDDDIGRTTKGQIASNDARAAIDADLVDRIHELLDGARIPPTRHRAACATCSRPTSPCSCAPTTTR